MSGTRSLVVLGAADGSLSTYRAAAAMGLRTIAVDRSPDAPGVALADEYLQVSTHDAAAVTAALAGRSDLAGVVAPSSDVAVPALRAVAEAYGLPARLSETAARASVDKWVLRGILDELGVSSYPWIIGDDPADLVARARGMRFPVVVKPADAQSGRGVSRCAAPGDVPAAVEEARRSSYGGLVMVEEEIRGTLCNCECVVDEGRVVFVATSLQEVSPPPLVLTMSRQMPAGLPAGVLDTTRSIMDKVCSRLDYRRGPLNLDLIVTPDGRPYVIELGLRTGGNGTDDMVRLCHGVDPVRAAVQAAVGLPIELRPHRPRPVLWRVLTAGHEGELVSVTGAAAARALPQVAELVLLARPGQRVRPYRDVSDRLGWYVVHADTPEELDAAAAAVTRALRFEVRGDVQR
ncbi:ATP-grasp domain-containing protein [Nonomuraea spiralis]|uniref:ATP-grasp domain-containing protein n=1 Tax=Nonomuraea spiralis TaxID=46182 RepID=A0ABV5IPF7_9ACTN|nr:ATP-grasp domain-containing protein [Nonomuraea spiralis]